MSRLNVLSIVIDIKISDLFGENPGPLLAVAAQTSMPDPSPGGGVKPLDRVGRPEITNVSMVTKQRTELRDRFNREKPFAAAKLKNYVARLCTNIMEYDVLDGPDRDWDNDRIRDWATLLVDDFLVLDISKECEESNYRETGTSNFLEIETALMDRSLPQTCGGRHPYNDIMDRLFTLYITADKKDPIGDGVHKPFKPLLTYFPYLDEPDFGAGAIKKVKNLKKAAAAAAAAVKAGKLKER